MRDVGAFVEGTSDPDLDDVEGTYLDTGGEFLVGEVGGRVVSMGAFRPVAGYLAELLPPADADGADGADASDASDQPADATGPTAPLDATAELKRMRVDPARQRRGYGRRTYRELERRARDRGFERVVLDTTPDQPAARGLYESEGFERIRRAHVGPGDERFELLVYAKPL